MDEIKRLKAEWSTAYADWCQATEEEQAAKRNIQAANYELESIESDCIVNGLITGGNAERRKAELQLILDSSSRYQAARLRRAVAEQQRDESSARREQAREHISWLKVLAAVEAERLEVQEEAK